MSPGELASIPDSMREQLPVLDLMAAHEKF